MKRLIFHIVLFLIGTHSVFSQTFLRMGEGPAGKVISRYSEGNTLHVVVALTNGDYALQRWEGQSWSEPEHIDILPKHGSNPDGEFTVTDMAVVSGAVYICGNYLINTSGLDGNIAVRGRGGNWDDISSEAIRQSKELLEIVVHRDSVHLLGKFRSSENTNMFLWDGNTWTKRGGLITRNDQTDRINDAIVWKGKLLVSGEFSKPGHDTKYSLAEFSDGNWTPAALPPFIGQTYQFADWDGKLILTGKPNSGSDFVKYNSGNGWSTLDEGLADIRMLSIESISASGDILILSGQFEKISTGLQSRFMYYVNGSWNFGEWPITAGSLKCSKVDGKLCMLGDYTYMDIQNAGFFMPDYSVLSGRLYLDLDANCAKDPLDAPLPYTKLILTPGDVPIYTDRYGYFEIPVSVGTYTLRTDVDPIYKSCMEPLQLTIDKAERLHAGNIGLKPELQSVDVQVDLIGNNGWQVPVTGSTILKLCLKNRGFKESNGGKLELTLPDWMDASEFTLTPIVQDGKYVWDIGNLKHDSSLCITCKVGSGNARRGERGDISFAYTANGTSDVDPSNNAGTILFEASDVPGPINKQLAERVIPESAENLHYHIGVQNIVGREVNRLQIRDTLDADLYITGIHEYASFPSDLKVDYLPWANGNYRYILTWNSKPGYDLADSGSNQEASKVFVQFRVQLAEGYLDGGTVVCNQAEVFLGNSEPLYTNEVCNTVSGLGFGNADFNELPLRIYPVPVGEILNLENRSTESIEFLIKDITGREVISRRQVVAGEMISLHIRLKAGIYFVEIPGYGAQKLTVR